LAPRSNGRKGCETQKSIRGEKLTEKKGGKKKLQPTASRGPQKEIDQKKKNTEKAGEQQVQEKKKEKGPLERGKPCVNTLRAISNFWRKSAGISSGKNVSLRHGKGIKQEDLEGHRASLFWFELRKP